MNGRMGEIKKILERNYGKQGLGSYWRVLGEGVRVWRNLLEAHRLHEHKKTHKKEQKLPV